MSKKEIKKKCGCIDILINNIPKELILCQKHSKRFEEIMNG